MDILIRNQILSGNLGAGWDDPNAVADELATFQELTWLNDLQELINEGHDVDMDIIVDHDMKGPSRRLEVICDSPELERRARNLMTDSGVIWQRFLKDRQA